MNTSFVLHFEITRLPDRDSGDSSSLQLVRPTTSGLPARVQVPKLSIVPWHHLHGHSRRLIHVFPPSSRQPHRHRICILIPTLRQPAYRPVNRPQPRPVRLVNIVMRILAHRDYLYKPIAAFHKPPPRLVGILIHPPFPYIARVAAHSFDKSTTLGISACVRKANS